MEKQKRYDEAYLKVVFAENLKSEMSEKRLTQQEFADALGTTQTQVSRWINGKFFPGFKYYVEICSYLQVKPDRLMRDPYAS